MILILWMGYGKRNHFYGMKDFMTQTTANNTSALRQTTLAKSLTCTGMGLHSGKTVHMIIKPAPANHGIQFKRIDLPDSPGIKALFKMVVDTSLATVIGAGGAIVSTVEHLMACFAGMGIDNALVELDAHEVPVIDGSAGPFTRHILDAGIRELEAPRYGFIIKKPIEIAQDGKFIGLYPCDTFKITYTIDFAHPVIQKQTYSIDVSRDSFYREICTARTFCFFHEVEFMKMHGLALGGSLDNAVVLDEEKVINEEGLRFPDEFVRHKILDCIGDFSLLGMPLSGHVVIEKSGHAFNHAFLTTFFASKQSWETGILLDARQFLKNR
jgi:UDP-3-O-[3-hydroxymyristoyl] N-acetylglucosamine deacetylase